MHKEELRCISDEVFDQVDTDANGMLDKQEVKAFFQKLCE